MTVNRQSITRDSQSPPHRELRHSITRAYHIQEPMRSELFAAAFIQVNSSAGPRRPRGSTIGSQPPSESVPCRRPETQGPGSPSHCARPRPGTGARCQYPVAPESAAAPSESSVPRSTIVSGLGKPAARAPGELPPCLKIRADEDNSSQRWSVPALELSS